MLGFASVSPAVAVLPLVFGSDGHRIIAEIAWANVSPTTRERIEELLGTESLASASVWADGLRGQPEYRWANVLHYAIASPFEEAGGSPDVLDAVKFYASELARDEGTKARQRESLKFLVHFVGDVHQPLHVSWGRDRGGNATRVVYLGEQTNLHAVWDTKLLRSQDKTPEEYAAALAPELAGIDCALDPDGWAEEAFEVAVRTAYPIPEDGVLGTDYVERSLPALELQLARAGLRLAHLLDAVFANGEELPHAWRTVTIPGEARAIPRRPPEVDERPIRVFFGDLHAHSSFSDGTGTPEEAFEHARDVAALDFLALTDHTTDGEIMPNRDGLLIGRDPTLYEGPRDDAVVPTAERLTEDGRFVALAGLEYSTIPTGNHVNVLDAPEVIGLPNGAFHDLVTDWLPSVGEATGQTPILQFNHPGVGSEQSRKKEYGRDDFGDVFEWVEAMDPHVQLIEVLIGPSWSQEAGTRPPTSDEESYLHYLNLGFHLAPTAGGDTHFGLWGTGSDARTGVLASGLTKTALLDALRARHAYATEDKNLRLVFRVDGGLTGDRMGPAWSAGHELDVRYWIADDDEPNAAYEIEVFSDEIGGEELAKPIAIDVHVGDTVSDGRAIVDIEFLSQLQYVFFKVEQENADGTIDRAWTAPVWFDAMGAKVSDSELLLAEAAFAGRSPREPEDPGVIPDGTEGPTSEPEPTDSLVAKAWGWVGSKVAENPWKSTALLVGLAALLVLPTRLILLFLSLELWPIAKLAPGFFLTGLGRNRLFAPYRRNLQRDDEVRTHSGWYVDLPFQSDEEPAERSDAGMLEYLRASLAGSRTAVVAGGGFGKSTLCRRIADCASRGDFVVGDRAREPVILEGSGFQGDVVGSITEELRSRRAYVNEAIVRGQVQAGNLLVLFDGLSEVSDAGSDWSKPGNVASFAASHPDTPMLFTSRPGAVPETAIQACDAAVVRLLEVSDEGLEREFFSRYLGRRRADLPTLMKLRRERLGDVPRIPLLLRLMAETFEADGRVASSRAELFKSYLDSVLAKVDAPRDGLDFVVELLVRKTYLERGGTRLTTVGQAVELIGESKERVEHFGIEASPSALVELLCAAGVYRRAGKRLRFFHESFESYFAARALQEEFLRGERTLLEESWKLRDGVLAETWEFLRASLGAGDWTELERELTAADWEAPV